MEKQEEQLTEAEISMVLDTYMYMDYREAKDGSRLKEILADLAKHPDYGGGGIHHGEYEVLAKAAKQPQISEMAIKNQSWQMGYDTGTAACTFSSGDGKAVYVVYRGTGDGEWMDNGIGMTEKSTIQQRQALRYYEEVVEREGVTAGQRLIVTGHSKGGNKAQYVTMAVRDSKLPDACYSVDGQGFSEEAVKAFKKKYGEAGYAERIARMYGIYGENDYVSVLGNAVILKENVRYIRTPVEKGNFAGYHDIKYMFASLERNPETGKQETVFHGRKNKDAAVRGELGSYAARLSAYIMQLPPEKRDGCALSLMQLLELGGAKKTGQNGEKISFEDINDFIKFGLPAISGSLFESGEGKAFIRAVFYEEGFAGQMKGSMRLYVNYSALYRHGEELLERAGEIEQGMLQIEEILEKLPGMLKDSGVLCMRLRGEAGNLALIIKTLRQLEEAVRQAVKSYEACDEKNARAAALV